MSWTFQDIRKFQYSKKNVLASDETEMDTFHKKDDIDITVGEKSYNLARSFRTSTINELTVIDFEEMFDNVSTEIIPNLIKKLKENPLFNIRFSLA